MEIPVISLFIAAKLSINSRLNAGNYDTVNLLEGFSSFESIWSWIFVGNKFCLNFYCLLVRKSHLNVDKL